MPVACTGRHHDNRHRHPLLHLTHPAGQLQAIEIGHFQIGQQDRWTLQANLLNRLKTIMMMSGWLALALAKPSAPVRECRNKK